MRDTITVNEIIETNDYNMERTPETYGIALIPTNYNGEYSETHMRIYQQYEKQNPTELVQYVYGDITEWEEWLPQQIKKIEDKLTEKYRPITELDKQLSLKRSPIAIDTLILSSLFLIAQDHITYIDKLTEIIIWINSKISTTFVTVIEDQLYFDHFYEENHRELNDFITTHNNQKYDELRKRRATIDKSDKHISTNEIHDLLLSHYDKYVQNNNTDIRNHQLYRTYLDDCKRITPTSNETE